MVWHLTKRATALTAVALLALSNLISCSASSSSQAPSPSSPSGHGIHPKYGVLEGVLLARSRSQGASGELLIRPTASVGAGGVRLTIVSGQPFRQRLLVGPYTVSLNIGSKRCQYHAVISEGATTHLNMRC